MYTRVIPTSIKVGDMLKLRAKDNENYEDKFWVKGDLFSCP